MSHPSELVSVQLIYECAEDSSRIRTSSTTINTTAASAPSANARARRCESGRASPPWNDTRLRLGRGDAAWVSPAGRMGSVSIGSLDYSIAGPCFGGCCGTYTDEWDTPQIVGGYSGSSSDVGSFYNYSVTGWADHNCNGDGNDTTPAWMMNQGEKSYSTKRFTEELVYMYRAATPTTPTAMATEPVITLALMASEEVASTLSLPKVDTPVFSRNAVTISGSYSGAGSAPCGT